MKEKVLRFIDGIKLFERDNVLFDTFIKPYSYYFAIILKERFGGKIYYDHINTQFIILIDNEFYNINGNLSNINISNLYSEKEYLNIKSIISDFILKETKYDYEQSKYENESCKNKI